MTVKLSITDKTEKLWAWREKYIKCLSWPHLAEWIEKFEDEHPKQVVTLIHKQEELTVEAI